MGTQAVDDEVGGVQAGSPGLEVTFQLGECGNQSCQRLTQRVGELVSRDDSGSFGQSRLHPY